MRKKQHPLKLQSVTSNTITITLNRGIQIERQNISKSPSPSPNRSDLDMKSPGSITPYYGNLWTANALSPQSDAKPPLQYAASETDLGQQTPLPPSTIASNSCGNRSDDGKDDDLYTNPPESNPGDLPQEGIDTNAVTFTTNNCDPMVIVAPHFQDEKHDDQLPGQEEDGFVITKQLSLQANYGTPQHVKRDISISLPRMKLNDEAGIFAVGHKYKVEKTMQEEEELSVSTRDVHL